MPKQWDSKKIGERVNSKQVSIRRIQDNFDFNAGLIQVNVNFADLSLYRHLASAV